MIANYLENLFAVKIIWNCWAITKYMIILKNNYGKMIRMTKVNSPKFGTNAGNLS